MASDDSQQATLQPRIHPQPVELTGLAEVFGRRRIAVGADDDGHVILARPDSVLCDGENVDRKHDDIAGLVERFDREQSSRLREADQRRRAARQPRRFDLVNVDLSARSARRASGPWTLDAVDEFRRDAAAAGIRTEYNHVVIASQPMYGSPFGGPAHWAGEMAFPAETATAPDGSTVLLTSAQPATKPPFLRQRLEFDRRRPRVLVLDSGVHTIGQAGVEPEHAELKQSVLIDGNVWVSSNTPQEVDDEDEPNDDANVRTLDFGAGHGTFISGIIRQICPDAEVFIGGVLSSFGDGDVSGVLETLERLIDHVPDIDIVVMSFGTNLVDESEADKTLFREGLDALIPEGAVAIAAAGNQQTCRPYYPAAFPNVIAVGGLAADGRAWFSNFGGWVDACAPAVDVVSTFFNEVTEQFANDEKGRTYKEWARWSGTSFAAPKVAAVIAQEMYLNEVTTAKEAWRRLKSHKLLHYPDMGLAFNV